MRLKATVIESALFIVVGAISAIKLIELFIYKNTLLPGWDTVPHFYLFRKFLELLGSGQINGYDAQQLGGSPLFYFYGPLPYFIGAFIKFIGGGVITDFFAWRILMFFVIISFAIAFWIFIRIFVHKSVGWLAIIFSLFYIFYPPVFRGFGIGAPAVLLGGLFTSSLAITFSLLFFSCLEKLRETKNKLYVIFSVLCFSAVVLSSPMIAVFMLFLWIVYALTTREKKWLLAQGSIFIYGVILSLFFIFPILFFHSYQSAHPQAFLGAAGLIAGLVAPFISLAAQYKNSAIPFAGLWNSFLFLASFIITVFFVYGFIHTWKNEKYRVLRNFFLAVVALQISSGILASIFPIITVHYYRSSPFVLSFYFAIALLGIYLAIRDKHMWVIPFKAIVTGIVILIISIGAWVIGLKLDRPTTFFLSTIDRLENAGIAPYYLNIEDYPEYPIAKNIVERVLQEKTQRIFVEGDIYQIYRLGSPHAIMTMLNLAGRSTINGLLNESAHQSDFLVPITHGISHSLLWGYNDDSLIYDFDLITQFRENIDRLRLFGVDYLIVHSVDAIERLNLLLGNKLEEVARFGEEKREVPPGFQYALLQYRLYRFIDPAPLVREPNYPVGLFVDTSFSNSVSFKKFATELFRRKEFYDIPVAFTENIKTILPSELNSFSYFIVGLSSSRDRRLMETLKQTQKPVIIYDNFDENINSFFTSIKQRKKDNVAVINIREFKGSNVQFENYATGTTPLIINLGNFPNWRSNRTVFEVTPGQMLVISSGQETIDMKFESATSEKVARVISIIALFGLPFYAIFIERRIFPKELLDSRKRT